MIPFVLSSLAFIGVVWYLSSIAYAAEDIITPSDGLKRFADAIARAEGFGIPGAIPTRANNPGDLARGGETLGAEKITVYPTLDAGWQALYHQLDLIARGKSAHYTPDFTIADMSAVWTATEQSAWAQNVARALGTTVNTPISTWIGDQR